MKRLNVCDIVDVLEETKLLFLYVKNFNVNDCVAERTDSL